jgi:endonuclease/exonuclease/phosphatase family metal-dependent hydrolase
MRCELFLLAGLAFASVSAADAQAPSVKPWSATIATFNINWGNVDLDATVKAIRETKADVMALQELNAESERHLRRELADEYPHMAFHAGKRAEGFGFLSKHPLADVKYVAPEFGLMGTYVSNVTIGGRRLQLINVHLEPDMPDDGDGVLDLLKRFRDLEATHLKEIRRIAGLFGKDVPVAVMGDFNSLSEGSAPTFLKERGFNDSAANAHGEADAPLTWRWRLNGVVLRYRLDYIFLPKGLRTVENRIVKAGASDHVPVVSRIEWTDMKSDR